MKIAEITFCNHCKKETFHRFMNDGKRICTLHEKEEEKV